MKAESSLHRGKAFQTGVALLERAGISNPALDASVLLGHTIGKTAATILMERNATLTAEEAALFQDLIERRCRRETLSRLIGKKEFYSRSFRTTRDVLDPRPETEILVERSLESFGSFCGSPKVLDVGTGSGAIAVTLAAESPGSFVVATDISMAALGIALGNAEDHGVLDRIRFIATDLASSLVETARFDVIVSNPPYVSRTEYPTLPLEVLQGDPVEALVAGPEGTEFYPVLAELACKLLNPGGHLLVEVGCGQSPFVESLFKSKGFENVEAFPDLAGIARVVRGTR